MHILIGIITAIGGLLWALHSLQTSGVNLNDFNPFTWIRRRQWEKKLGTKPMHALVSSMEAAALLVVAIAKEEGEVTRDTKLEILAMFENDFGISRSAALEMFSASSYMLADVMDMPSEVRHVMKPSKDTFTDSHVEKLLAMLAKVAALETEPTEHQLKIIEAVKSEFAKSEKTQDA